MENKYFVHESSYADDGCKIGDNTKIWHFTHIMPGAVIGSGCSNWSECKCRGKSCNWKQGKIQNNVSIYDDVILEDDVFCGPSCVFTNVFNPRAFVERKHEYRKTLVKKGASIGANATIVCGSTLGSYCFVGAGSVVTSDVPAYALVYGTPAKVKGWMCSCGVKLDEALKCTECGKEYIKTEDGIKENL